MCAHVWVWTCVELTERTSLILFLIKYIHIQIYKKSLQVTNEMTMMVMMTTTMTMMMTMMMKMTMTMMMIVTFF